jgi:hypothetical protein
MAAAAPGALGLHGVHHPGGQHQVHRLGLADGTRQALRAAGPGDDAQLDLGLTELGRVGGDHDVAHHRQLAATAQREAGHCGDHRLADRADGFPVAGDQVAGVGRDEVVLGQHADVGAGGKGFVAAGDHDRADAGVGVEASQRGAQLVHQAVIQRVQRLRPVQRDQAGAHGAVAADFGEDVFVGHDHSVR